jgi:hypothetical protein
MRYEAVLLLKYYESLLLKLGASSSKKNPNRGILLSPNILCLLGLPFNWAYFFRIAPFEWNGEEERLLLRDHEPKWTLRSWKLVTAAYFLHYTFLAFRFYELTMTLAVGEGSRSFGVYLIGITYVGAHSLGCVIQLLFIHKRGEIVAFVNQIVNYYKIVQGKRNSK